MQIVRASRVSGSGNVIGPHQSGTNFTIQDSISPQPAADGVVTTPRSSRRRRSLELVLEVSVVVVLLLSCLAYAVYALLSMSR